MSLVYLIIYISIFLIIFKAMFIGLILLFTFIIGKIIKFDEKKWKHILTKIKFKGFMIFMLIIYLLNIILIVMISKGIGKLLISKFNNYVFGGKAYLLIFVILIMELIYKIIFKRDKLKIIANKFNDNIKIQNKDE